MPRVTFKNRLDGAMSAGLVGHGYIVTHYVSPYTSVSGATNDYTDRGATSYSNATNPLTPTTLGTALARASAGHVVESAPGTYLTPQTADRNSPSWKPLVSGTSGNPIIFTARYPAAYNRGDTANLSKLWFTNPSANFEPLVGVGGHAGAANTDIVWDGFWCEATSTHYQGSNGMISVGIGVDTNAPTRVWFRRFWGTTYTHADDNNYDCFQIRAGRNVTIEDGYFQAQVQTTFTSRNNAFVKGYGCQDVVVRNNTINNMVCGVFFKGKTGVMGNNGAIYHNLFLGITGAVFDIAETMGSTGSTDIYQNLAYDFAGSNAGAMHWDAEAGSDLLRNCTVYNNTFVMGVTPAGGSGLCQIDGGLINGSGCVQRDNIFAHTVGISGDFINAGNAGATQAAAMSFNYDWLFNNGATMTHAYNGAGSLSLATFRTNSGWEVNATVGDPSFENAAADDYRLTGGSSARTASSTSGPVGCYITGTEEIGQRAAPSY